jgi:hypothetical protein
MVEKSKKKISRIFLFTFVILAITTLLSCQNNSTPEISKYRYDEVKALFDEHRVVSAYLTSENILKLKVIAVDKETGEWKMVKGSCDERLTSLEYRIIAGPGVLQDIIELMNKADDYNKSLPDNDPKKLDFTFDFQVEESSGS